MTIASQTTAETMLGDGGNRRFPFTFKAWEGEVRVALTAPDDRVSDATALADILLSDGDAPGGLAIYPATEDAAPLPAGWKLTVLRNMDFLQPVRLVNAARYDPVVIEQELDRLTAMIQQLREMAGRAVHIPVGSSMTPDDFLNALYDARAQCLAATAEVSRVASEAESRLDAKQTAAFAALEAELAACLERITPLLERAETAAAGAEAATADAVEAAAGANAAEGLARKWATHPEDEPVLAASPGDMPGQALFSAFHWAQKARNAVEGGGYTAGNSGIEITSDNKINLQLSAAGGMENGAQLMGDGLYVKPAKSGACVGAFDLAPFRPEDLPEFMPGWHFANGDRFLLDTPQGQALESLPDSYKADWGITLGADGEGNPTINLPSLFHTDGRGLFLRAGSPSTPVVGDAIRNLTGRFRVLGTPAVTGVFYTSGNGGACAISGSGNTSLWTYMDAGMQVPVAGENRPLHREMTPVIFLGV